MKKKTYVIMVGKTFPNGHPKAGQPTNFKQQILEGKKIHTIRENYDLWFRRVEKVNFGKAIISLREWEGKPYKSKQVEFMRLERAGCERFYCHYLNDSHIRSQVNCGSYKLGLAQMAVNDGFESKSDLLSWFFKKPDSSFKGAIIHFTDLRYAER